MEEKIQDKILEEWKKNNTLVFILYKEEGVTNRLRGEIIDFDLSTISIACYKNYLILARENIIKIKGTKNE